MTAPLPNYLNSADALVLYGESFASRLLLGTSRYPSPQVLENAVETANPAMITVSLRRQGTSTTEAHSGFWDLLKKMSVPVLPNTAGCHSPQEVITTAQMAREVFENDWIKLELIGDDYTLQPDTLRLVMEWGFDGVLLNTAVALANDPVAMAKSFAMAVDAGRTAYLSGAMKPQESAQASTPLVGTPFWHQA